MQRRWLTAVLCLCLCLAVPWGAPAHADQRDPDLGRLFADLRAADSLEAAQPIESEIWARWLQSDDATVNRLMQLGATLLNTGEPDRALAAFDEMVHRAPDFAEGWNKRATTLYMLGRFADSKADIARVLALEPRHFGALSGLGLCNAQLGLLEDAVAAFRRALEIDPNLPGAVANVEELTEQLKRNSL